MKYQYRLILYWDNKGVQGATYEHASWYNSDEKQIQMTFASVATERINWDICLIKLLKKFKFHCLN